MNHDRTPLARPQTPPYLDRNFNRQATKILPGEFYATREDEVVVTVLGSCVAVCLLDPIALVGGMNHFMLPIRKGGQDQDPFFAARYGMAAMKHLTEALLCQGARQDRLVAKAFGGGRVLPGMSMDVGDQNIGFLRQYLQSESIPLWSEDMGGDLPRKIYFFPHTGQVLVKRLGRAHNDTVLLRELSFLQGISHPPIQGEMESLA